MKNAEGQSPASHVRRPLKFMIQIMQDEVSQSDEVSPLLTIHTEAEEKDIYSFLDDHHSFPQESLKPTTH